MEEKEKESGFEEIMEAIASVPGAFAELNELVEEQGFVIPRPKTRVERQLEKKKLKKLRRSNPTIVSEEESDLNKTIEEVSKQSAIGWHGKVRIG